MATCQWRMTVEPVGDGWASHHPVVREFETVEGVQYALDLLADRHGPPVTVDPSGEYRVTVVPIDGGFVPDPTA